MLLADVESAADLPPAARCMSNITLQTFSEFRLRVNLGAGKTELLVDPRGQGAAAVRGELLQGPASLCLADGQQIRICPEYKYLGVPQVPRDTGRRDVEHSVCRGRIAEVAAGPLLTNDHLPWPLRVAWIDGRLLPSAYSSLSTMLAPHPRCLTPLVGFLDRVRRKTWRTWQNAHHATNVMMEILVPCTSPPEGLHIARTRLLVQLCVSAPEPVWEIVEAAYYRDVPWVAALVRAAQDMGRAASLGSRSPNVRPAPRQASLGRLQEGQPLGDSGASHQGLVGHEGSQNTSGHHRFCLRLCLPGMPSGAAFQTCACHPPTPQAWPSLRQYDHDHRRNLQVVSQRLPLNDSSEVPH